MWEGTCIILGMTETWTKNTYACDPDECDTLIEVTSSDKFGFPSGSIHNVKCPCGRTPNLLSVEPATITPTNERNKMETAPYSYNANNLVTYKLIKDGEVTYPTLKVNELEAILDNPTLDVIESMPNGEHVIHQMKRTDVSELFRQRGYHIARIADQERQLGQIIDNLTAMGWYNPNTDKEDILSALCEILGHEPKQTVRITGTLSFEVDYDIPLDEMEDFDAHYFLQDTLTLDAYNGDVVVESWTIEDSDVDWDN